MYLSFVHIDKNSSGCPNDRPLFNRIQLRTKPKSIFDDVANTLLKIYLIDFAEIRCSCVQFSMRKTPYEIYSIKMSLDRHYNWSSSFVVSRESHSVYEYCAWATTYRLLCAVDSHQCNRSFVRSFPSVGVGLWHVRCVLTSRRMFVDRFPWSRPKQKTKRTSTHYFNFLLLQSISRWTEANVDAHPHHHQFLFISIFVLV